MKPSGKPCVDCRAEGITTKRKTFAPGPRCMTHRRRKRAIRRNYSHERHIFEAYGISSEEYDKIIAHQGGACAICGRARGLKKRLSVDHCHATGLVRGCLCVTCNKYILGHARDEIDFFRRAIKYLERPPATEGIGWRIVPPTGAPVRRSTETSDGD